MRLSVMKRYIAILIFMVALPVAAASQVRTSYFMEGSTFRTDMNPALAPTRGYVNFPMLGGVSVGLNNNFFSLENMFYPTKGGQLVTFFHKDVDRNDFLRRMPRNNSMELSVSEQIIGFGAHTKRFFWSAGINLRANADINIPKQVFSLVTNLGQGSYDINGMHVGLNSYVEAYVGAAVPIKDFITVGMRIKGLFGVAHGTLRVNNMNLTVSDEAVSARLNGELSGNIPIVNSNLQEGEEVPPGEIIDPDFSPMNLLPEKFSNGGLAVDLGAEVRLLDDRLRVSAALVDLGFIRWGRASSVSGNLGGSFSYMGFDFDEEEIDTNKEDITFVSGASTKKGMTTRLNCSLNFGAEYTILDHRIGFGLLSHTKFCQSFAFTELTASVNFKPLDWLTATLSHTFLHRNQPGVIGFALNIHPKGFNLFLGADFIDFKYGSLSVGERGKRLLLPVRQRSMNLNVGLGFSLGRATYTKAYKDGVASGKIKAKKVKTPKVGK